MTFRDAGELYDFYNNSDVDLNIVVEDFFFSDKIYRASQANLMISDNPVSREEFVMEMTPEVLAAVSVMVASWIRGFVSAIERLSLPAEGVVLPPVKSVQAIN